MILSIGAAGILLVSTSEASIVNLLAAAGIAGAGIPPAPAMIRARWAYLHSGTPTLGTAYALESSFEDFFSMAGPPLIGYLNMHSPYIGFPAVVIITIIGMYWLASLSNTEPPIKIVEPGGFYLLATVRGLPVLFGVTFSFGGMLGALDVAVISFAISKGHEQLGFIALGLWAAASAVGGMAYGAMRQGAATGKQLVVIGVIVWIAMLPLAVLHDLGTMTLLLAIGGTSMAPAMVVVTRLAEKISPKQSLTLALAWITAAMGLGVAAGTTIQGWANALLDRQPMFLVSVSFALLAALIAWKGASTLRFENAKPLITTPWSDSP